MASLQIDFGNEAWCTAARNFFFNSISKPSMSLLSRLALRWQGLRQGVLTRTTLKWNEVQLPNPNFRFWDATYSMHIAGHLKTSQAQALYPDCNSALDHWPHFDEVSGRFFCYGRG